jgi:glycosyltransferase involved in cell wall biosynthesis
MAKDNVWVIIPAYNESKHVSSVIKGVKRYAKNIIVVDDGSNDKTYDMASGAGAKALRHIVNLGKGAALKTGCDYAVKKGAKNIIAIDADGQHNPKDILNFLKALKNSDIVFGQRRFSRKMPFIFRFGNWFIDNTAKVLFSIDLKDTQCGYRAFTAGAYKKIRWKAADYSMESEMIANSGKKHLKYGVVPIATIYSDKYKGTTVFDGIKIVLNMVRWRLFR